MAARLRRLTSRERLRSASDVPSCAGTPRDTDIERWAERGDVPRLEAVLLEGKYEMLEELKSTAKHVKTKAFLRTIPIYKTKIAQFFDAIAAGDLASVRELSTYRTILLAKHPLNSACCIHVAVICQQPEIVRFLLDKAGELVNSQDKEKRTALHYAAVGGDANIYRMLVAHAAKTEVMDVEGYSPFYYKQHPSLLKLERIADIYKRHLSDLVINGGHEIEGGNMLVQERKQWYDHLEQLILDGKAYQLNWEELEVPSGCEQEERTLRSLILKTMAIHQAIKDADEKIVKQLMDKPKFFSARDENGLTPLLQALVFGQSQIAKYILLKMPVVAKETDLKGRTALHYAALLGDRKLYDFILGIGSLDPKSLDKEGNSAEYYLSNPDPAILKRQAASTVEAVFDQAADMATTVKKTTRKGRRPTLIPSPEEERDGDNSSPEPSDQQVEQWILEKNFDKLEQAAMKGKIAYLQEKAEEYHEIASFLEHVSMNEQKVEEIQEAVKSGNLRRVKILIDRKKLALSRAKNGRTPLLTAIKHRQKAISEYLIEKYPESVLIKDRMKRTPLHYAALGPQKDKEIYQKLLDVGAHMEAKDRNGRTAQFYLEHPDSISGNELLSSDETDDDDDVIILSDKPAAAALRAKRRRSTLALASNAFHDATSAQADGTGTANVSFDQSLVNGTKQNYNLNGLQHLYGIENEGPSDERINQWIEGDCLEQLEQLVLDGRSHLLKDKKSHNATVGEFLKAVPQYQAKIDAIHKAVEEGDVRRVKSLIDNPKLALARDRKGATALHNAVLYGQTDTMRFLVQKFPHAINAMDNMDRTALHYASADRNGGHYIKLLQKAGADAFIEDKLGHTPFYYRSNPLQLDLKSLKDEAVMDQLMAGELPRPLLQDLEEDIIEWLQTANLGKLEELVLNGYGDLLLGKVHDVDDPDVLSFLDILPQYQAKIRAIHTSVQLGNLRDVKALIDRKKLALARDNKGATPLHNAVLYGKEDIVKYLLRTYPQAVNAQDHFKRTSLHYAAAMQDDGEYYKLLRKAGADPNIQDGDNKTPKYYLNRPELLDLEQLRMDSRAALRQALHQRVAPSYLEASIQLWMKDGNISKLEQLVLSGCGDLLQGRNPSNPETEEFLNGLPTFVDKIERIHHAVREGNVKYLQEAIDKAKLAIARDRKGATPLHDAVLYEKTEVVRFMAQTYPAALNGPDYNKRTPLHYAAASRDGGHFYKILEKAGADPKLTDNEGHTPEFYLKNPGKLNLKIIRERDLDFVVEDYGDRQVESRASDLSVATPDSVIKEGLQVALSDAAILTQTNEVAAAAELFSEAYNQKLIESQRCSIEGIKFLPTTENGKYLAESLGPTLTKAIADVVLKRPVDPIGFLSDWLYNYLASSNPGAKA